MKKERSVTYHPTICVTQKCNLNCRYCYQQHNEKSIPLETAKHCIDDIFQKDAIKTNKIEVNFIGGEPLLQFDLLKSLYEYTKATYKKDFTFFATTNGTILSDEMKSWFSEHKNSFILGLSLDGDKETHDYNRSNSFDKIDINFFKNTYPTQNVKMTLTEFSLKHFAHNIKFIHSLGFNFIGGVNLYEGTFDWSKNEYLYILIPQLRELVDYYLQNPSKTNQMFKKKLANLDVKDGRKVRKYCGIGSGTAFYDVDGIKRPCSYCTPMIFDFEVLKNIEKTDFSKADNFVDMDCFNNCYIYPICPHCSGANYLATGSFSKWDRSKCKIQKLITLFIADLEAKKIIKNPNLYDKTKTYYTIRAIEKIRELYYPEYEKFLELAEEIKEIMNVIISAGEKSDGCGSKKTWTESLNILFKKFADNYGCEIYNKTLNKEWLYDITICKQSKGCIDETFLVAESEWSIYGEDIWYDFQKLLLSNSKYKVMIFSRKNIDEQEQMVADMKKQVQSYRTCNGIFLFACFINGHGYEFEIFNCDEKQ